MGKRGPQPGWKRRNEGETGEVAAAASKPPRVRKPKASPAASTPAHAVAAAPAMPEPLNGDQRNNPRYLSGDALRLFAHRRAGVAWSAMEGKSDEFLREQCRYAVSRSLEEA
jgi:hypothetical protein